MRQISADGTTEFVSTRTISATSISRDRALRRAASGRGGTART